MFIRAVSFVLAITSISCLAQAPAGTPSAAEQPATSSPKAPPPPEVEIPFPADLPIPPATVLSPEETLATIKVPAGFRVEIVASEPMITTPVAMQFDENGRLWVVEMNGYMPNVDGKGEDVPNGRVVVCEDTDNDGRMDKSTVFLEGLVMPRAISLRLGGALVAEPPAVYWCPDANGDLKADDKVLLIPNYTAGGNPEHMPNGLYRALDNWLYNAKSSKRYRFSSTGELKTENTIFRGQWGICQDDFGRLYYNYNSDQLRADLLPAEYLTRNPNFKSPEGINVQIAKSQRTWPGRVTPGVNRGYRKGQLIDGKLAEFTAACGPLVYRGDLFPREFRGNSFVCETSANLIKRNLHIERDGDIMAKDAEPGTEFLTSTSERFRPVNLADGPDGALYCVDIARGLVQHITYVSPWLRRQIIERGLEQPLNQGRIWRIIPDNAPRRDQPRLGKSELPELIAQLNSDNGWTRDTAQRLLVEKADPASVSLLQKAATGAPSALGRLHALWVLEGLGALNSATVSAALGDIAPKVRASALHLAKPFLKTEAKLVERIFSLAKDTAADVQLQLLLTLGELDSVEARESLRSVLDATVENHLARSAAVSGMRGRELEVIRRILESKPWGTESPGRADLIAKVARCVLEQRKSETLFALLELGANETTPLWQRVAILNGVTGVIPVPKPPPGSIAAEQLKAGAKPQATTGLGKAFKPIKLATEPAVLATLAKSPAPEIQQRAMRVAGIFVWPGKPGYVEEQKPPPLTDTQKEFVAAGQQLYTVICASCHQPNGQGQEGLAPPIASSEWATGPESRLVRIVLQGVGGPITVNAKEFNLDMPGLGAALNDEQIAQVLSYIRRDLGNEAPVIETATVSKIREATKDRGASWIADELLNVP